MRSLQDSTSRKFSIVYMSGLVCIRLSPSYSSLMGIRVNSDDDDDDGGLVGDDAVLVLLAALAIPLMRDDRDRV